jgi:hypothetical protein
MIRSLRYPHLVSTNAKVDFEIEVPGTWRGCTCPKDSTGDCRRFSTSRTVGWRSARMSKAEAEGLVDLADLLTLLRLRSSKSHRAPG